jgi:hypothetical protein
MAHSFSARPAFSLASAAALLAACNGTAPRASQPISLAVNSLSAAAPAGAQLAAAIQIGSGANSLTINQAEIVLARIELSPSGGCATTGETDDCDELQVGPTLVTLPVDGTTKVVLDAVVPTGTYSALHAKLDAVTSGDDEPGAAAFLTAHPDFQGVSVKVSGVFTDASSQTHSFTFTSAADAEIEAGFQPPVTVGASTSNLTVAVDVASWFKDATGAVIDPTNAANAAAIGSNIERSFRAFEDDDRDGIDDHEGGTGSGD